MVYIDLPNSVCLEREEKRRIEQPERAATDTAAMLEQVTKHFVAPAPDKRSKFQPDREGVDGAVGIIQSNSRGIRVNRSLIRNGLIVAGLMNIGGVLLFSRAFTNIAINKADPVVMSNFGLLMIVVWGLAYLGAAAVKSNIKWLAAAFAVEKLVYVIVWIRWLSQNSLTQLYSEDFFAGTFFTIYGANDLIFMLFFASVFISQSRGN